MHPDVSTCVFYFKFELPFRLWPTFFLKVNLKIIFSKAFVSVEVMVNVDQTKMCTLSQLHNENIFLNRFVSGTPTLSFQNQNSEPYTHIVLLF